MERVRVLFVCLGNICRSPTAQGVFEKLVAEEGLDHLIEADSAGTADWHEGEPPDPRTIAAARRRGIDLSRQRGRQVRMRDCERFDYVVAMDRANLQTLQRLCPNGQREKLHLLMDFAPGLGLADVPDPYYGGPLGFEQVLDLVTEAAAGLLQTIREEHLSA